MVGRSSNSGAYVGVILQLAYTVIIPLIVGQLFQKFLPKQVKWLQSKVSFGNISNVMILLLIWATFSDTFYSKVTADAGSIIVIMIAMVVTFFTFSGICFGLCLIPIVARAIKLDRPDSVAVTICGATKTIALGIPVISVIYGGAPDAGLLIVPLITYHATQIIMGSILIPKMKAWVLRGEKAKDPLLDPLSQGATAGEVQGEVGNQQGLAHGVGQDEKDDVEAFAKNDEMRSEESDRVSHAKWPDEP